MSKKEIKLQSNEILEAGAYIIGPQKVYLQKDIIPSNILNDYSEGGIISATLQVFCGGSYINIDGEEIISYENKELLKVGDIVSVIKEVNNDGKQPYISKSNKEIYFRVVSTEFIYDGSPMQRLKLQEIKR